MAKPPHLTVDEDPDVVVAGGSQHHARRVGRRHARRQGEVAVVRPVAAVRGGRVAQQLTCNRERAQVLVSNITLPHATALTRWNGEDPLVANCQESLCLIAGAS